MWWAVFIEYVCARLEGNVERMGWIGNTVFGHDWV